MSALARVDWPATFLRLLDGADDQLRERALYYGQLCSPVPRPAAAFAAVVAGSTWSGVFNALGGGLDSMTAIRIAVWLQDVAHIVLSVAGQLGDPRPVVPPAAPGLLLVDPELEWLPLLDLAADVARSGGLVVEVGSLQPGIAGKFKPQERRIVLDREQHADEHTWAHELSHALDPLLGRREGPELDEDFADILAPLLLEEQPTTVRSAGPLIEFCRAQIDGTVRAQAEAVRDASESLPEPGVFSLAAFIALPVLGR